jgi:DNA-binding transcriptional MerR regulator
MVYYGAMVYTVNQLAKLAGVSVRTLHYYDQIGLLSPTSYGTNGYRQYEKDALLRLQQILFYRELDLKLEHIKELLDKPGFNLLTALEEHKITIQKEINRKHSLITTITETIDHLKGNTEMKDNDLFKAFSDEEQEQYAMEAEKLYDPLIVQASNRKWKNYSSEKKAEILAEGNRIYTDILSAMALGVDSFEVQACVERWRKHMDYFWTPTLAQLVGLAEDYNNHPGFKRNLDKIDPCLAEFILEAVKVYVARANKNGS